MMGTGSQVGNSIPAVFLQAVNTLCDYLEYMGVTNNTLS
jgi:hypothetical protein